MKLLLSLSLFFCILGTGLLDAGDTKRVPYMGVATKPVSEEVRHQLGFPEGFYLTIMSVAKSSPAEDAGLVPYDILSMFEDQILVNPEQLRILVRSRKIGDEVNMTLHRAGETKEVDVVLGGIDACELKSGLIKGFNGGYSGKNESVRKMWKDFWSNESLEDGPVLNATSRSTVIKNDNRVIACKDNDCTVKLRMKSDGSKYLEVRDKNGKIVFEGDITSSDDFAKLSKEIQDKVRELEGINLDADLHSLPDGK